MIFIVIHNFEINKWMYNQELGYYFVQLLMLIGRTYLICILGNIMKHPYVSLSHLKISCLNWFSQNILLCFINITMRSTTAIIILVHCWSHADSVSVDLRSRELTHKSTVPYLLLILTALDEKLGNNSYWFWSLFNKSVFFMFGWFTIWLQ